MLDWIAHFKVQLLSKQPSESSVQSNMELPQDSRIDANLIVLVERIDVPSDVVMVDERLMTSLVSSSERLQKKAEMKKIPARTVLPRYLEEYEVSSELTKQPSESSVQSNMELPQDSRIDANLIVLVERIDVPSYVVMVDDERLMTSLVSSSERLQKKAETKKIPGRTVLPRYLEEYEVSSESKLQQKKIRTKIKRAGRAKTSLTHKPAELQKKEQLQKEDELQSEDELGSPPKAVRRRKSKGLTDGSGRKLLYKVQDTPSGIRIYKCGKCLFKTRYPECLRRHVLGVHNKVRQFKCDKCPYAATLRQYLVNHITYVHENVKPFECSLCPYKCGQLVQLKRHVTCIHEQLKPFKCKICGFRTSQAGNLKKHVRAVHEQRRDHTCDFCTYRSSTSVNLRRHVRLRHEKIK